MNVHIMDNNMRKIHWHGIKDGPDYDLYSKRNGKTWDIVHGVDGWVIYTPCAAVSRDRERAVVGHVDRDIARLQAEELITMDER